MEKGWWWWCWEIPNNNDEFEISKGGTLSITTVSPPRAHFSMGRAFPPEYNCLRFGFVFKAFGRARLQVFSRPPSISLWEIPPPTSSGTFRTPAGYFDWSVFFFISSLFPWLVPYRGRYRCCYAGWWVCKWKGDLTRCGREYEDADTYWFQWPMNVMNIHLLPY